MVAFSTWQSAVALALGLVAVAGVLWRALRPRSDEAVCEALERQAPRVKRWLEGDTMFATDISERREMIRLARETSGKVQAIEHAMNGLPREVGRLADAVDRFEGAAADLAKEIADQRKEFTRDLMEHGKEVAELRGAFDTWNGEERRHGDRRRRQESP